MGTEECFLNGIAKPRSSQLRGLVLSATKNLQDRWKGFFKCSDLLGLELGSLDHAASRRAALKVWVKDQLLSAWVPVHAAIGRALTFSISDFLFGGGLLQPLPRQSRVSRPVREHAHLWRVVRTPDILSSAAANGLNPRKAMMAGMNPEISCSAGWGQELLD